MELCSAVKIRVSATEDVSHFDSIREARNIQETFVDALERSSNSCAALFNFIFLFEAGQSALNKLSEVLKSHHFSTTGQGKTVSLHCPTPANEIECNRIAWLLAIASSFSNSPYRPLVESVTNSVSFLEPDKLLAAVVATMDFHLLFQPMLLVGPSPEKLQPRRTPIATSLQMTEFTRAIMSKDAGTIALLDMDDVNRARKVKPSNDKRPSFYERHLIGMEALYKRQKRQTDVFVNEIFRFRSREDELMDSILFELGGAFSKHGVKAIYLGGDAILALGEVKALENAIREKNAECDFAFSFSAAAATVAEFRAGQFVLLDKKLREAKSLPQKNTVFLNMIPTQ